MKIFSVILFALLAALLLVGCTSTAPEDTTENVSQTGFWASAAQESSQGEAEDTTAAQPVSETAVSQSVSSTSRAASSASSTSRSSSASTAASSGTSAAPSTSSAKSTDLLTLERAKEIALQDAAVSADQAVFTKAKMDTEDGIRVYEIEFFGGGWEYEYTIHAGTGRILERDAERDDDAQVTRAPNSAATDITLEQAKEIALKDAGLSAGEVTFTKAKLDYDDGIQAYEIEFFSGRWEYEYTIHAGTGVILKSDRERD